MKFKQTVNSCDVTKENKIARNWRNWNNTTIHANSAFAKSVILIITGFDSKYCHQSDYNENLFGESIITWRVADSLYAKIAFTRELQIINYKFWNHILALNNRMKTIRKRKQIIWYELNAHVIVLASFTCAPKRQC